MKKVAFTLSTPSTNSAAVDSKNHQLQSVTTAVGKMDVAISDLNESVCNLLKPVIEENAVLKTEISDQRNEVFDLKTTILDMQNVLLKKVKECEEVTKDHVSIEIESTVAKYSKKQESITKKDSQYELSSQPKKLSSARTDGTSIQHKIDQTPVH